MTPRAALAFVKRHGIVLESGRGPVPSLADAIAGEPIRGGWWSHPKGRAIFNVTRAVRDDPNVLVCRLVAGKITYVHRRLWPALVRLASAFDRKRLAAVVEEHTATGAHRVATVSYPRWVPAAVRDAARDLSLEEARARLAAIFDASGPRGQATSDSRRARA